jgi:hypothetical protein
MKELTIEDLLKFKHEEVIASRPGVKLILVTEILNDGLWHHYIVYTGNGSIIHNDIHCAIRTFNQNIRKL